jgi:hypothetical protein
MNSPDVLLRFVQAVTPPSLVFSCVRFLTAPLRALSPTGLFTAIVLSLMCMGFLPLFEIRRVIARLLFLFRRPLQGLSVCFEPPSVFWRGSSAGVSLLIRHLPTKRGWGSQFRPCTGDWSF